ncbi:MAG: CBS domain-containing protein [Gammaproteobacteria bacterium]|nr:CBS domain-containing protein [Gammaproteobacteria bacterium]
MKLAELIRGRQKKVVRIRANSNIVDAANMMTSNKIGALLVEDDADGIVGILSERDIVGGMGPHGADLHDVMVSELMTRNVIRCSPADSVNEAMAMMTDRRIRHLPVFDGDELVGFISIGDLVKCRIMEVQGEAEALRQYIMS